MNISNNFITIRGDMVESLGLSGNELLAYAVIYGFSQDGQTEYTGSLSYLQKWLNCSKQTAITTLKKLVDKGLIIKNENTINGVKFCSYTANLDHQSNNFTGGGQNFRPGGGQNFRPNNISNNNINNIIEKENYIKEKDDNQLDNQLAHQDAKQDEREELFNEFWNEYTPVKSSSGRMVSKGSKEEAKRKFIKLLKEGEDYDKIINGLRKYINFCRRNDQLTCGVTVFLNQKRWADDYDCIAINAERSGRERQEPISIVETYAEILNNLHNQE